jgi:hypothetical protein
MGNSWDCEFKQGLLKHLFKIEMIETNWRIVHLQFW